jgi:hypothetical protein
MEVLDVLFLIATCSCSASVPFYYYSRALELTSFIQVQFIVQQM